MRVWAYLLLKCIHWENVLTLYVKDQRDKSYSHLQQHNGIWKRGILYLNSLPHPAWLYAFSQLRKSSLRLLLDSKLGTIVFLYEFG